jgi:hypothetical protein
MRKLAIIWTVLQSLTACYGDVLPELQSSESYESVSVEGWPRLPNGNSRHIRLDTDSREVIEGVAGFLKGLDCVAISFPGPLATSDAVKITLRSKGESTELAIAAGKYVGCKEPRGFYEIRNVSESAGNLLLRKLMTDYPDLIKEVPRTTPPP